MMYKKISYLFLFVSLSSSLVYAQKQSASTSDLACSVEKAKWSYVEKLLTSSLSSAETAETAAQKVGAALNRHGWMLKPYALLGVAIVTAFVMIEGFGRAFSKGKDSLVFDYEALQKQRTWLPDFDNVVIATFILFGSPASWFLTNQAARLCSSIARKMEGSDEKRVAAFKSFIAQLHVQLDKVPVLVQPIVKKMHELIEKNDLSLEQCDVAVVGITAMAAAVKIA